MRRKVLLQLVVPLLSLCVLFLLLTVDPVRSAQSQQLLEISVLYRQSDTSTWSVVRQGMEQAAVDLNAELRFLVPAGETAVEEEQRTLLEREAETGTDAILLIPSDREALADTVHRISTSGIPVVTLETDMSDASASACVGADNTVLGEALGTAALNGAPEGALVVLLDTADDTGVTDRVEAAEALLKAAGRRVHRCAPIGRETLSVALDRTLAAMTPAAVVAFDAADLEQAAALLADREDAPLLYGAGSTATVAAYLEQSTILSIAAQNDFAAGYLAVGAAVRAIQGQGPFQMETLEFVMVRQENMYEPENQKLLFPVTR